MSIRNKLIMNELKVFFGVEGRAMFFFAGKLSVLPLADLADSRFDILGLGLEAENLPKRIRIPKKEKRGS